MIDDVFCKIVQGQIRADVVYQDEDVWAIKDINPQAPIHILIIPTKHFTSLEDFMDGNNDVLLGKLMAVAHKVAHQLGVADDGYRLIMNEGENGGKLVPHLHIHFLGGKKLGPKMVR